MAERSAIEWCDSTFNPWEGCQKVGPGCDHCYAENRNARFGGGVAVNWGPGAPRRRTSSANWAKPLLWEREHEAFMLAHGRRRRVFCASLADVFDNQVPTSWRIDLFNLIARTPNLDWLLLTKRIGNVLDMLDVVLTFGTVKPQTAWPWHNVWIGATVVNQAEADRDVPKLMAVPAAVRFLSIEPMLGPIELSLWLKPCDSGRCDICSSTARGQGCLWIDWIIAGGESGPHARPAHPDWFYGLRDQCAAADVPFLFKQWGEWVPRGPENWGYPSVDGVPRIRLTDTGHDGQLLAARGGNDCWMNRTGKKAAGRLLRGVEHNGFPAQRSTP